MERKFKHADFSTDYWMIVNKQTGEIPNVSFGKITVTKPTDKVTTKMNHFLYLDTDRIQALFSNGITEVELGFLMVISQNLAFNENICLNIEGKPLNTKTIADMLGQSFKAVNDKLKKLEDKNIIARKKITDLENLGKVIMVNPHLLKRGKDHNEFLASIFYDFTHEVQPNPAMN